MMSNNRLPRCCWILLKRAIFTQRRLWVLAGILWLIVYAVQYQGSNGYFMPFTISNMFILVIVATVVFWYYLLVNNKYQRVPTTVLRLEGKRKSINFYACALSKPQSVVNTVKANSKSLHSKDQLQKVTGSPKENLDLPQQNQLHSQTSITIFDDLAKVITQHLAVTACGIFVTESNQPRTEPLLFWSPSHIISKAAQQEIIKQITPLVTQNVAQPVARIIVPSTEKEAKVSVLAMPVIVDGAQAVVLVMNKADKTDFVSDDEQELLALSNNAQVAITNYLLQQKIDQQAKELHLINRVAQAFVDASSLLDVESACRAVLLQPSLQDLFNFDGAEINLWDEYTQTATSILRVPQEATEFDSFDRVYHQGQGYTGWIIEHQQPLLINNTSQNTEITPKNGLENFNFGSFLGVPLKVGPRFLGTLELLASPTNIFTQRGVTTLEIVANQVAIALDNARRVNQTNRQLQNRVDELNGLQRVSNELNSTLDVNKILNLVLEEAMRLTQADFGDVYFYNPATGNLTTYKFQSWQTNMPSQEQKISAQTGIIGRSLQTGASILVPDVRNDKDFVDLGQNTSSKVVVPIHYGGESIGVINLESKQLDFFNNNQLQYLEALANHAAVAIGNAQAYQQQRLEREQAGRRADQLARLSELSNTFRTNRPLLDVLEDIAFAISESVGYDVVLVSLIKNDPPLICPEVGAGIPIVQLKELQEPNHVKPLANLHKVMEDEFRLSKSYFIPAEQKTVWENMLNVPYIEKHRSVSKPVNVVVDLPALGDTFAEKNLWQTGDLLLVPLQNTDGGIIGLLTVANPIDDLRPTVDMVQTLETFANHAAAAIENAQLFDLEKQRRELADTLRGVAEAISSQLDFEELLNIILRELARVIDYDSANVQLLEEDKLRIIGGHGWEDSQKVIDLTFSMTEKNPNRFVIETQEPIIVKDTQIEYPASFAGPVHRRVRSWLGVPLTYGTNVLGVMAVDKKEIDFFTQEDVDVVLAFANQVAVALQNARLFEGERQQVRQLAALTEVAQSINRALQLNEVLNLVLDAVFELVSHRKGSIWLIDSNTGTVKMANTNNIPNVLLDTFNESNISVASEPFASVIESGEVLIVGGNAPASKDNIANYGLPFPDDVTYVPLKTENGVIGILAIEVIVHNKTMLELVTTLADLAAVAIDNARLLEDTRRRATEMQNLYNLGVEVSGLLKVRQVMKSAISNTLTLTNSHAGAILFWEDQLERFIVESVTNQPASTATEILTGDGGKALWLGLTEQIAETGQPVIANLSAPNGNNSLPQAINEFKETIANSKIQSLLGVPIVVQTKVIGAIFVTTLTPHYFTDRDVQSLSFVANQASVAVRNAQLVQRLNMLTEELEQRVALRTEELAQTLQDLTEERDRVGTLYQIARELSSSFDLDRVLNEALNLINRAIGISHGSILLLDQDTEQLVYRAALGRSSPLPRGGIKTQYKSGVGLAGSVMQNREPVLVADLTENLHWLPSTRKDNDDRRSAIAVPLSTGDDVLGVLLLFHPDVDYFTEDQLKLVTAASAQVATTVNNAELYRLITDQANRLGVLYRKQASEAAKNEAILKGITDGVLVLDANRDIVLVNPKAAEILNIVAADVENQPLRQILGRSESPVELELTQLVYDNLLNSLNQLNAGAVSSQFRVESGPKVLAVALAPVSLGSEDRPSVVAVIRDISREAEIERLKNEFISTVSHELRTPMTSIKGYSDLLLSGKPQIGGLNSTQHRFVQVIQSNANRLTELVNDILEISRIETGRVKLDFVTLDIIELIREVAVSFEGQLVKKAMNLELHLPDTLPDVYADKARLTQILVNLVGNAWQYTPEGGNINVYAKLAGNFVQIDVEDDGIGIPEKDQDYIFERFFRSERTEVQVVDGTGLGLSITKSFVEMLGGEIKLKSTLDVGTTFTFTVPLDIEQGNVIATQEFSSVVIPHLLIIDDNKQVLNLLAPELEAKGYQISTEHQGQEVFSTIDKLGIPINTIVLNLALQDVNSFILLEQLCTNKTTANIPVWISSFGYNTNEQKLSVQVVDAVTPTTDEHVILAIVKRVLNIKSGKEIQTRLLSSKHLGHRILIIDQNVKTSQLLKETLTTSGYDVHCAFNSRQALDMALGNKPELIFLSTRIPDFEEESVISQLCRDEDTRHIPVVIIGEQSLFSTQNNRMRIIGKETELKDMQSVSIDSIVSEIVDGETDSSEIKGRTEGV